MTNNLKQLNDVIYHLDILERTFRNAFNGYKDFVVSEALASFPEYTALKKYLATTKKDIEIDEEFKVDTEKLEYLYGVWAERMMRIINNYSERQKVTILLDRLSHPEVDDSVDERLLSLNERAIFLKTFVEKKKYELTTVPTSKSVTLLLRDIDKIKKLAEIVKAAEVYTDSLEKDVSFYEKKIQGFDKQLLIIKQEIEKKRKAEEEEQYIAHIQKNSPLQLPNDDLGVYKIQSGENLADVLYGEAASVPLPASYEVEKYIWKKIITTMISVLEKDSILALKIGLKEGVYTAENSKVSLDRLNDLAMYIMAKEKKILLSKKIISSLERVLFE